MRKHLLAVTGAALAGTFAAVAPATATPGVAAAAARHDHSFSRTCTATDYRGVHYAGNVTISGRLDYDSRGGVHLENAKIRANEYTFTITASRWINMVSGSVLNRGRTGTLSPGESTGAWTAGSSAAADWGRWRVRGHRTATPEAVLRDCFIDG
jgi:hypothetical protein